MRRPTSSGSRSCRELRDRVSLQAGIFYFESRPVPQCEAEAVLGWMGAPGAGRPAAGFRQAGLFMAPHTVEQSRGCAITFDGRLDNREELPARLGEMDGRATDAALALAAYTKWGAGGLAQLVGDWSLTIWDGPQKTVVLASDYAGVRPLYYCVQRDRAVWSTRLQPLADWTAGGEIDEEYAAGFLLSAGCADRTPYRGIWSPPPGHAVFLSARGTRIEPFWKLPAGETIRYRRIAEYEEQFRSLFEDAVRCRLRRGVPVLAELSGGLDSSSVVCMASHLMRKGLAAESRMVTLSVEQPGSVDAPFRAAVEKFCGFESIHVAAADYPFLSETETGGAAPALGERIQTHHGETARRVGAQTYLTGRLGDLVTGNLWDDSDQVAGLLRRGQVAAALRQSLAWSKILRIPIWWVLGRAIRSNLPMAVGSRRPGTMEDSLVSAFRRRTESIAGSTRYTKACRQVPVERRMYFRGLFETLALRKLQVPEPLEHLDYAHPFAHRPLVVFLSSIPTGVLCGPGEPRRLMRKALGSTWPAELRQRRSKDSFAGAYLDALRPLGKALLEENRTMEVVERGWVDCNSLKKRLERMLHSLECNEPQLRNIVLLEFWLRSQERRLRLKNLPLPA